MTNLRKSLISLLAVLVSLSFLWPQPVKAYEHRSVLLDCARKYYSVDWIKQLIDLMEENKANELLFHFSENEGMRIESKQYPWLTQGEKGVYTQEDIIELGTYAKEKGIELIPSFDSPGHLRYVLDRYEQHYGYSIATELSDQCIDLANPKAIAFIRSLQKEYGELFLQTGSSQFDMGGDEVFSNWLWSKAASWKTYISKRYGRSLKAYDAFTDYMNESNAFLKELGFRSCRMYNDQLKKGNLSLDPDIVIEYWTIKGEVPKENKVLNYLNFYLYYILDPNLSYLGGNADAIEREWTPQFFLNKKMENPIIGSSYCIWADIPDSQTEQQVFEGVAPLIRAWGHKCTT